MLFPVLAISTEEGRDNGKHAGDVAPIIDLSKPVDYETAKLHIGEEEMSRLLKSGNLQMETAVAYGAPRLFVMARTGKSIEHEVSVGMISKRLTELGVGNYIMNRRNGPDIVAYLNGRSIAVEYETGRKSISSTEKMLQSRIKSFWNTVVFVNDASYGTYSARFGASAVSVIKIGGLGSLSTDRLEKAPPNEA